MTISVFKKTCAVLILGLGVAGMTFAEPGQGKNRGERIIKRLDMTPEQAEQFRAVMLEVQPFKEANAEQRAAIDNLLDKGDVDGAAELASEQAKKRIYHRAEMQQKLAQFLTVEQLEELKEIKQRHGHKHGKRSGQASQ